jgi:hypothetical protein
MLPASYEDLRVIQLDDRDAGMKMTTLAESHKTAADSWLQERDRKAILRMCCKRDKVAPSLFPKTKH